MQLHMEGSAANGEERAGGPDSGPALARILLASGGHTVATHLLYAGRLIIGRTAANDLQIDSRFVSRHHCQIITSAQSSIIEDLNSTNGMFVQGKRVRYHNLNDGDVVTIGQHELLYLDERASQRTPMEEHASTTVLPDHTMDTHTHAMDTLTRS
jgi:pSer/pThr/pTyr-binding forkhead associated (FHA) protein